MSNSQGAGLLEFLIMDKEKKSMRLTIIIILFILVGVCLYLTIIGFKSGEKTKIEFTSGIKKKPILTGPYAYLSCTFIMLLLAIFGIYSRFVPNKI